MPNSSIVCPSCNQTISLDEALTSQIRASLETEVAAKMKQQEEALQAQLLLLEKEKEQVQQKATQELAEQKKRIEEQVSKRIQEEKGLELKFLEEQLQAEKKKRQQSEERELQIRKKEADLEEKQRTFELQLQRQLEEERKRIREKTEHEILEQQRHKDMEKEKVIADLRRSLEDAQRKASQGSQQTQGEVQELHLEELLRQQFPSDIIEPVGKGITGADVRQIVRSSGGTVCGTILWESKQTKSWSDSWIPKLKNDLRSEKADIPALVTTAFSDPHWGGMTIKDGVWVCTVALALPLAMLLRKSLIDVGYQKAITQHQGGKAEHIYAYITSTAFQQQVESLAEVYTEMQQQVQKERIAFEKIWKQREGQIARLYRSTVNIYGSIQGIAGANAIPQIRGLEVEALLDSQVAEQQPLLP